MALTYLIINGLSLNTSLQTRYTYPEDVMIKVNILIVTIIVSSFSPAYYGSQVNEISTEQRRTVINQARSDSLRGDFRPQPT